MVSINGNNSNSSYINSALNNLNESFNKLSSGTRINSAKDDAAGLAISNRMTSQINAANQGMQNANDGISLVQTAEGALSESTNLLQQMRELSIQASNATYSSEDRASMNNEFSELQSELNRISEDTNFNGQQLLNGDFTASSFAVGEESIEVSLDSASAEGLGVDSLDISTVEGAQGAIEAIDDGISTVSESRSSLGATQSQFESAVSNLGNVSENLSAARSRISDTDFAEEVSNMTMEKVKAQAGIAMQAQMNQSAETVLKLLQ